MGHQEAKDDFSKTKDQQSEYLEEITPEELKNTFRFKGNVSAQGSWVLDLATNHIAWSESAFIAFGVTSDSSDAPRLKSIERWVHPDDLERVTTLFREGSERSDTFGTNFRMLLTDGRIRYVRAAWETYSRTGENQQPDRAYGTFIDRTDAVMADRAFQMASNIGNLCANTPHDRSQILQGILDSISSAGCFAYAAYHQVNESGTIERIFHSGNNRFMATEETRRVSETCSTGLPQHLIEGEGEDAVTLAFFSPMTVNNVIDGTLVIWSEEPGQLTQDVIKYFSNLTWNLGLLIERIQRADNTLRGIRSLASLFGSAIESNAPSETGMHTRVASLAQHIAQELELDQEEILAIEIAANIYDLGMLWIPNRITQSPLGLLSGNETPEVARHTTIGETFALLYDLPWPLAEVMGQHHEHFDGSGGPKALKGEEILLAARIVSVASAFESLTRSQPYRLSQTWEEATHSVQAKAGSHFDPQVVAAFMRSIDSGFSFDAKKSETPTAINDHPTIEHR